MRGSPRWAAVLAIGLAVAACSAFVLHRSLRPAYFSIDIPVPTLTADGFSFTQLSIHSSNRAALREFTVKSSEKHRVSVDSVSVSGDSAHIQLRAGVIPGEALVVIAGKGFTTASIPVEVLPSSSDAVGDGTPDFLRLHDPADANAFRRWFTLLAESQYFSNSTQPEIDDCAALVRFSYREALRSHDSRWSSAILGGIPVSATDVRQYQYPFTPLGPALFRVREGAFQAADISDGTFSEFADAETLLRHNTFFLSRDLRRARPGDLLFFRQASAHMPFHVMVFVGQSQLETSQQRFVVYHTGPSGKQRGEIRRLSVAQLMAFPDARWRPELTNGNFLGVYRWNILRGDD